MSVIEKLDGVLALVAQAFDMPVRWSANGNIVPVVYTDDCEIAAVYSDREDDECPDKAAAIIAAVNYFRDHGPAIRQAMIDAEKWRFCTSEHELGDGQVAKMHINAGVNIWRGEEWLGFHECSPDEAREALDAARLASDSEGVSDGP